MNEVSGGARGVPLDHRLDYCRDVFHIGIRVPELEPAMASLGRSLGLSWAPVVERDQGIWTPGGGATSVRLRFTYSCAGPQHVELLQGEPGSVWDGSERTGIHHQGVWVPDVAAATRRLVAEGWTLELAGKSPEDGYGSMTYVRSPTGMLLEPVAEAARPRFERWWAGEPLS